MELQRVFKNSYLQTLRTQVNNAEAVERYNQATFELDTTQVLMLSGIYTPEGLAEKMDPTAKGDFASAVALYEAYRDITPLIASMENFWAYLTHTQLFEYTQKRYPNKGDKVEKDINNIIDHWFVGKRGLLRNAAASLWWGIHMTVDEDREDKYALSRFFFSNYTFRTRAMGNTLIIRHREAMKGILGFLLDNKDVSGEHFENRGKYIAAYFNKLGAVKQLSALDQSFFRSECERIKDKILAIQSRKDLKGVADPHESASEDEEDE